MHVYTNCMVPDDGVGPAGLAQRVGPGVDPIALQQGAAGQAGVLPCWEGELGGARRGFVVC